MYICMYLSTTRVLVLCSVHVLYALYPYPPLTQLPPSNQLQSRRPQSKSRLPRRWQRTSQLGEAVGRGSGGTVLLLPPQLDLRWELSRRHPSTSSRSVPAADSRNRDARTAASPTSRVSPSARVPVAFDPPRARAVNAEGDAHAAGERARGSALPV